MHWAAHGHTAAELIYKRADAEKLHMGMTNIKGSRPTKAEVMTAKNYLNEDEINILNRIVTTYLEFAELQALRKRPMYMKDWIEKLDDFLKITDNDILSHSGKVSSLEARKKAELEYDKYKEITKNELSSVEKHFLHAIEGAEDEIKRFEK